MITFLVIVFKHKRNTYQKILLLVYVLTLTYYSALVYFVKSGLIINYPHLRGTGPPINFLHLVTFMLFVRSTVKNLKAPKRLDLILLCLPILIFIGVAPFFFENVEYKIDHIQFILNNEDSIFYTTVGFIPAYWNFLMQLMVGMLFSSIAIYMLVKKIKDKKHSKSEFIWLICVSSLMFLGNFIGMISLLFDSSSFDTHTLGSYLFALYIIIIFLYPFFEPRILYGALIDVKKKISGTQYSDIEFTSRDFIRYREQIEGFFSSEISYLKPDFRQDDLAKFLSIPKKELSQITTQLYQRNFSQLINEKRIDVVLKKFRNLDWLNYSLEGVALEVGFKSRTTFIKAFKEKTGSTPSEYKKTIS
ncbi:AraC family transcriptional regulator [Psychroserpens burtonensis]|uniref:AraC family transcriptional regulator n=1 Tax=Psychroserpens burtonensis TaxID=49278 RepID=UPI00146B4250|nr:helix-turn-helix domain-containing protein [Psychroserpens burtonensis]